MKIMSSEAIVVPGAGLTANGELTEKAVLRMDTAISALEEGTAPYIVVSGSHSFMLQTPPSLTEAQIMKKHALQKGIDEGAIYIEDESLDTIGNALFTKKKVVELNGWKRLAVVTSKSHLPRTVAIFKHVLGEGYEVQEIAAPENVTLKERIYEAMGMRIMKEVFRGTKPGDNEAIQERLFDLVPGYRDSTLQHLAIESLTGLVKHS
jgi:uncharacterized SAM-binding protein YcdF (DUF218 family)